MKHEHGWVARALMMQMIQAHNLGIYKYSHDFPWHLLAFTLLGAGRCVSLFTFDGPGIPNLQFLAYFFCLGCCSDD